MTKILIIFLSYFLGSIPFGYLVGKYFKKIDIREYGSGNIGGSNALRVMGARYALMVLAGDCLKGFFMILLAREIARDSLIFHLIVGSFAIIGHNWPIFLGFKGGKGIATTFGVVLAFYPLMAIISALIWGVTVLTTRFAALGSIISVFSMFLLSLIFHTPLEFKIFILFVIALAIIRHLGNINRLVHKKENKIISELKNKSNT